MKIFTHKTALISHLEAHKSLTTGFVPTMGALHSGHLSLVDECRRQCAMTVVSIFVNPTQFNDKNDLRNYPRNEKQDLEMVEQRGADVVFIPSELEIYPEPDTRTFDFGMTDKVMEGATRPGHFNGVAQVVSRLFDIVRPDKAFFGQKDFQQIAVIRALVKQMDYKIQIVECPIIRDTDGLALSSRNALLTKEKREAAPVIYATLRNAVQSKREFTPQQTEQRVCEMIDKNSELKVIYFNIVDPVTLARINSWDETPHPRGCIAVQAGEVRLIDNIEF